MLKPWYAGLLLLILLFGGCQDFPSRSRGLDLLLLANLLAGRIYSLPDTSVSLCYDDSSVQPCSAVSGSHPRQDGLISRGVNLEESDSGLTVTSSDTSLVWQRCARGQTWTGSTCGGAATLTDKSAAQAYCSSLASAGRTWRLPTLRDLLTLPLYSSTSPAINGTLFPAHPTSTANFWTSNADALVGGQSWTVDFISGSTFSQTNATSANTYVRCVSGTLPDAAYVDNADGTVYDSVFRLTWTKCPLASGGQPLPHAAACSGTLAMTTWANIQTFCANLSLGGRSWRMPDVRELHTLLDPFAVAAPTITSTVFPGNGTGTFWTSTTNPLVPSQAWSINFNNGATGAGAKAGGLNGRCVSGP